MNQPSRPDRNGMAVRNSAASPLRRRRPLSIRTTLAPSNESRPPLLGQITTSAASSARDFVCVLVRVLLVENGRQSPLTGNALSETFMRRTHRRDRCWLAMIYSAPNGHYISQINILSFPPAE